MANLYELTSKYQTLQNMLDSEQTEEDRQIILDTIEGYDELIEEKVENYCKVIKNLEHEMQGCDTEIKKLTERKKRKNNQIEYLKANLSYHMSSQNIKKIKAGIFDVGLQKSGSRSLAFKINDMKELPEQFRIVEYKADKKAIKDYMKEQDVEDTPFAYLESAKETLRIRS